MLLFILLFALRSLSLLHLTQTGIPEFKKPNKYSNYTADNIPDMTKHKVCMCVCMLNTLSNPVI